MIRAALSPLALVACLSMGCGSSPPATFYALSARDGAAQATAVHTVKLRRPGIPGYLDRPEIVRKVVEFRLGVADNDRWGSPLDEMVGRVLAEDIEQRLSQSHVYTEDGSITADADATVEVDIRRFDVGDRGEVTLVAEVAIEKGSSHAPAGARSVALHEAPSSGTTSALVGAMSDLLGQLADQIAGLLRGG